MLPYFARHINNWFKKDTLEYHYQKHLILLFAIHCMRMFCRHDDGFAFVEFDFTPSMVISPVPSRQVTKASPPDSWVLISSPLSKANKGDADGFILYQCFADDLAFLVGNLIF